MPHHIQRPSRVRPPPSAPVVEAAPVEVQSDARDAFVQQKVEALAEVVANTAEAVEVALSVAPPAKPVWKSSMKKAELFDIAVAAGLKVSEFDTKDTIIEALRRASV